MRPFPFKLGWGRRRPAPTPHEVVGSDTAVLAVHAQGDAKATPLAAFDMHQRALLALEQLLDGAEEYRAAWFAKTGVADPALANQVALLLRADAIGSRALPTDLPQGRVEPQVETPDRIGPYRLVERLGQGGMGEVFLGVRDDGLFDQKVAIKVIRAGLLSPQLAVRFAEERRILARLQHPHIAQLFDGGVDPSGLSYIVMEHLQGQAITDYVRAEGLGLEQILQLFLDVCSAVQFAHQNLVVHADIKPNNIVVTPKAGVKLLDFGIAQLIDPDAVASASSAQPEPMTRAYAAPERLVGSPASVAGDVYALGALLFELLTGGLPQALTNTEQHTVAISAPGPSNWTLPSREIRSRPPPHPIKPSAIEGDLDAIVGKALSARASQRYTSVVELSEDIQRFLKRQPVKAHPDTWRYRAGKFVHRYRLGVALTCVAMLGLMIVAGSMTKLYLDAEQARARAAQRFAETRNMANYMIVEVDPQLARLPGSLDLRRDLVSKSHAYLMTLEADPAAPPALRLEVANGYLRLARIYGLDLNGGTGDLNAARASLKRAVAILDALPRDSAVDTDVVLARAQADMVQGSAAFLTPDAQTLTKGLALMESASRKYAQVLRARPDDVDAALGLWRAQAISGRLLTYLGHPADAAAILERNLNQVRPPPVTMSQRIEANYIRTGSYLILAEDYEELHQYGKSLSFFSQLNNAITELRRERLTGLENDYMQSSALAGMGRNLARQKLYERAIASYQDSLGAMRRILMFGENDAVALSLNQESVGLANTLSMAGRHREAAALVSDVVASTRARVARAPDDMSAMRLLALYLNAQAKIADRRGDLALGCAADKDAWNAWVEVSNKSGIVPMDKGPTGPIDEERTRLKTCGQSVSLQQMAQIR